MQKNLCRTVPKYRRRMKEYHGSKRRIVRSVKDHDQFYLLPHKTEYWVTNYYIEMSVP